MWRFNWIGVVAGTVAALQGTAHAQSVDARSASGSKPPPVDAADAAATTPPSAALAPATTPPATAATATARSAPPVAKPAPAPPGQSPATYLPASTKPTAGAAATPPPARPVPQDALFARRRAESAFVHMHVTYPGAWLELRSLVDEGTWHRICPAPCDQMIHVAGSEARVAAPNMTTSNVFRIEAGGGAARFKVSGGSERNRAAGVITLSIGIPVALAGMGVLGYGKLKGNTSIQAVGIVTLIAGGATILTALPILSSGSTRVRNAEGSLIARKSQLPQF